VRVNLHIEPREQFRPYLNRQKRWSCLVAHRRAGKTVACIQDLIKQAIESEKPQPRLAYIAPTYSQAKDVAWSYLKQYTFEIPGIDKSESELAITFPTNGGRIRLYGAENYDRLRGLYLDGVIIDEAGDIDPRAWPEVIRPALSDRQGWATFIGTPKGRNAFYDIYKRSEADTEGWYSVMLRASQTGILPEAELADARLTLTEEQYAQEYECSFDAAVIGAYFGKDVATAEAEGRVRKVLYDRSADVFACWDLGIGDNMALWTGQLIGQEWHWLNYYENKGHGLDHYVSWLKALPYDVVENYVPHDAEARELQTGKSRRQYLEGRGLRCRVVKRHIVDDGISAVRSRFNRMYFDAEGCAKGIDCLRMYRAEFDDKHGVLKTKPLHDWSSHGADAFRTGVMGVYDRPAQQRQAIANDYDPFKTEQIRVRQRETGMDYSPL
jgi:phage terminase large subunit